MLRNQVENYKKVKYITLYMFLFYTVNAKKPIKNNENTFFSFLIRTHLMNRVVSNGANWYYIINKTQNILSL